MSTVSTHVLDIALGKPAVGIQVTLRRGDTVVGAGVTDSDGRVTNLHALDVALFASKYQLIFDVAEYFSATARDAFYSEIVVSFNVHTDRAHYHVPLLLSPFGYSTYRGS